MSQIIRYGHEYAKCAHRFAASRGLKLTGVTIGDLTLRADGTIYQSRAPNDVFDPDLLLEEYALLSEGVQRVPVQPNVPAGGRTYKYIQVSQIGRARHVANNADDIPEIGINTIQFDHPIIRPACFYSWDNWDERAVALAAANGYPLTMPEEKAKAAQAALIRYQDILALQGVTELGVGGLFTDAAATTQAVTNGDWGNPSTTSEQILSDAGEIISQVSTNTLENRFANRLVVSSVVYGILQARTVGTEARSIKEIIERNYSAYDLRVEPSSRLNNVAASVPGDTICAYSLDPEVLRQAIPVAYQELPSEQRALKTLIYAEAEGTGAIVRRGAAIVLGTGVLV